MRAPEREDMKREGEIESESARADRRRSQEGIKRVEFEGSSSCSLGLGTTLLVVLRWQGRWMRFSLVHLLKLPKLSDTLFVDGRQWGVLEGRFVASACFHAAWISVHHLSRGGLVASGLQRPPTFDKCHCGDDNEDTYRQENDSHLSLF
jgi:hypothetical protein